MVAVLPRNLRPGDEVRVVAPSRSKSMVDAFDHSALIEQRFHDLGLRLSYGRHVQERDAFDSSSIASRVEDLHEAFADSDVAGVLTVIGGFNANELLPHLDWDLIARHPKVFCGYSDITALQNAMLARSGLVTYSGPHWSSFGMRDLFEPTGRWFRQAVMQDEPFEITAATEWTDDAWFVDQDDRGPQPTPGWWAIRAGDAEGPLIGGNLCTLNLLQGTPSMPSLDGAVLAVEDDALSDPPTFARDLTSLLQAAGRARVRAVLIGRFQKASGMTRDLLTQVLDRQPLDVGTPVLANMDFGHTNPQMTLPIGGEVRVEAASGTPRLILVRH